MLVTLQASHVCLPPIYGESGRTACWRLLNACYTRGLSPVPCRLHSTHPFFVGTHSRRFLHSIGTMRRRALSLDGEFLPGSSQSVLPLYFLGILTTSFNRRCLLQRQGNGDNFGLNPVAVTAAVKSVGRPRRGRQLRRAWLSADDTEVGRQGTR